VTSALIGPRSMEHLKSHLAAADVHLDDDLIDQIDAIVSPGLNLNPADAGGTPPWVADRAQRRR
jgi:aryl-alcohol dehydrogenase-like predicted oxidoreductase